MIDLAQSSCPHAAQSSCPHPAQTSCPHAASPLHPGRQRQGSLRMRGRPAEPPAELRRPAAQPRRGALPCLGHALARRCRSAALRACDALSFAGTLLPTSLRTALPQHCTFHTHFSSTATTPHTAGNKTEDQLQLQQTVGMAGACDDVSGGVSRARGGQAQARGGGRGGRAGVSGRGRRPCGLLAACERGCPGQPSLKFSLGRPPSRAAQHLRGTPGEGGAGERAGPVQAGREEGARSAG